MRALTIALALVAGLLWAAQGALIHYREAHQHYAAGVEAST